MHYLYKILNVINGKVYIGQSNKEKERWRKHKYLARQLSPIQYIHRAMAKHGIENFIYEIIAVCITQINANELEAQLIKQYNSRDKIFGYNVAPGGECAWNAGLPKEQQPMYGKKQSEYQKKKMSEIRKGKLVIHSQETIDKIRSTQMGHQTSIETRNKISKSLVGRLFSDESKIMMSTSMLGNKNKLGKVKYSIEQEKDIIQLRKSGLSFAKIAKMYDMSPATIANIMKRHKN